MAKGLLIDLLIECRCIQKHLKNTLPHRSRSHVISWLFYHLMSEGKVNMALQLLAEDSKGGVLSLDSSIPLGTDSSGNQLFCSVRDILLEKHPHGRGAAPHVLLDCTTEKPCYDPVIFQCLTGDVIKWAAIHTHGAAGPSGGDAYVWRWMCTSFGDAAASLCDTLACVACYLSTTAVDSAVLMPFVACRLIPLDKRPGVRPIGIGDVPHQIIAKAILFSVGDDVSAAGPLQTCAGHVAGSEVAVYAMRDMFHSADCEAALLVDASNAFNSINCNTVIHNILILCPALSTVLHNTYSAAV